MEFFEFQIVFEETAMISTQQFLITISYDVEIYFYPNSSPTSSLIPNLVLLIQTWRY